MFSTTFIYNQIHTCLGISDELVKKALPKSVCQKKEKSMKRAGKFNIKQRKASLFK